MSPAEALRFTTVLAGLVTGSQPLAVEAPPETTSVELLLDGESVELDPAAPWRFRVELGMELLPHTLEAIARDADGGELARVRQAVNRSSSIATETGDGAGLPLTRLVLEVDDPLALTGTNDWEGLLMADGAPLEPHRVATGNAHFVAVIDRGATPELRRLARDLGQRADPVTAAATHGGVGPATHFGILGPSPGARPIAFWGSRPGDRLRLIDPLADLGDPDFQPTGVLHPQAAGGLAWVVTHVQYPPSDSPQRLADAVAVAVLQAVDPAKPGAIILVAGPSPGDASFHSPEHVRRFAERSGVPLEVWRVERSRKALIDGEARTQRRRRVRQRDRYTDVGLEPPAADEWTEELSDGWGDFVPLTSLEELLTAAIDLRTRIDRQRVVWVKGTHAPEGVTVSPGVEGVRVFGGRSSK